MLQAQLQDRLIQQSRAETLSVNNPVISSLLEMAQGFERRAREVEARKQGF
jgi:hypothetical protein